jgi:hypothetical protein
MGYNGFMEVLPMTTTRKLPHQSSVRLEEDLQPLVAEWFEKNPGWTISQLANQAIRKFVMTTYTTEPVELVPLSKKEGEKLMDKVMLEHADALERLK